MIKNILRYYSFFQDATRSSGMLSISAAAITNEYHLLYNTAGVASFVQTAVPVFGIIDSVFGLMNQFQSIFSALNRDDCQTDWFDSIYLVTNCLGLYGNAQLLEEAINAFNNPFSFSPLYAGFAIKYWLDFLNALTNQWNIEQSLGSQDDDHEKEKIKAARLQTLETGLLAAGFTAITLGHPIGFVLLGLCMIAKMVYYGNEYLWAQNNSNEIHQDPHTSIYSKIR